MGADFLSRTKRTIIKHVDYKRIALSTPDLFTSEPKEKRRSLMASVVEGQNVTGGEHLMVEYRKGSVHLRRGNSIVGSFDNPSNEIITAVKDSGGTVSGVVNRVHKLAKKAEVSLC